jgi:hypothetical protein
MKLARKNAIIFMQGEEKDYGIPLKPLLNLDFLKKGHLDLQKPCQQDGG